MFWVRLLWSVTGGVGVGEVDSVGGGAGEGGISAAEGAACSAGADAPGGGVGGGFTVEPAVPLGSGTGCGLSAAPGGAFSAGDAGVPDEADGDAGDEGLMSASLPAGAGLCMRLIAAWAGA